MDQSVATLLGCLEETLPLDFRTISHKHWDIALLGSLRASGVALNRVFRNKNGKPEGFFACF